jgi:hypothetical protein
MVRTLFKPKGGRFSFFMDLKALGFGHPGAVDTYSFDHPDDDPVQKQDVHKTAFTEHDEDDPYG